jgi:hypothetical protein
MKKSFCSPKNKKNKTIEIIKYDRWTNNAILNILLFQNFNIVLKPLENIINKLMNN